jgi:hypothetical protein
MYVSSGKLKLAMETGYAMLMIMHLNMYLLKRNISKSLKLA